MIDDITKTEKIRMEKTITSLQEDLKKIRTGRAQVSMLDSITVTYYDAPAPLSQLAALSCPDAKSFLIAPWDASSLKDIEQAIVCSNVGMAPQNDGKVIRLKLPELTEERREELAKQVKKTIEEARISIRQARKNANDRVKEALKEKAITEDDKKRGEEQIQKLTDEFIKKADEIGDAKIKELMTI